MEKLMPEMSREEAVFQLNHMRRMSHIEMLRRDLEKTRLANKVTANSYCYDDDPISGSRCAGQIALRDVRTPVGAAIKDLIVADLEARLKEALARRKRLTEIAEG